jgi:WS/DGAT/MGAT family acyltransferase
MTGASLQQDRMSGVESFMWELERDPQLSSAFANLTLFDRAPERDVFRTRMARAVQAVPRLRQRVVDGPAPWDLPRWVEDDEFDLDHHLRWVDLGGDATRAQVDELAATLARQPFDRERPLWEFVTIEGLRGGRAAMLQRLHHTITDGEGGIRLSVEFLDLERSPAPLPPRRARPAEPTVLGVADQGPWWSRAAGSLGSVASTAVGTAASLPGRTTDLAGVAQSTLRQALVGHRRSPLWTERSLDRWFATTVLSLEDARTAAHRLGGSVNDLFVAGAVSAAGQVHRDAGAPVEQLRMSMPVSTRNDRSVGGNAFSPTQMLVPTGPLDPATLMTELHRTISDVRGERAIGAVEGAATAAAHLPSALLRRTGRYLTDSVDFVCSNVRAAPFELFIAGAFMQANYPMGPLAGTAFNLTTMSYRGWLFLGLTVDTAAIADPAGLLARLDEAYDTLLATADLPRRVPDAC